MVLRRLLWSALMAGLAALSAMAARRVAGRVWRMATGEDPPYQR
jgi:hypothetical protein